MKYKVLISAPYFQDVIERFRPILAANNAEIIIPNVDERLEENELLSIISDIDGVICGDDRFTPRVLHKATKLKVISKWGTGIDSIDKEECSRLGIKLCNTPNAFTSPVADSVLGYILSFARNIPWMDKQMKSGVWKKIPGFSLSEKVLGVVGIGNIGKAVVKRARGFDMKVLGHDIKTIDESFVTSHELDMVSLEYLLQQSDVISLNCDLNPTSIHILNSEAFCKMGKKPLIINTARGPLIKEIDLIEALNSGVISGAGLDVFEDEPLAADSVLLKMDNVLVAPHNSNSSPEAWEHVHKNTVKNLLEGLTDAK